MEESHRRIIIIDDNQAIFADFQEILGDRKQSGQPVTSFLDELEAEFYGESTPKAKSSISYELGYASQGKEGVEKVRNALKEKRPFALAFVDMRMPPGWDGIETIKHLWMIDPELQVVICTAYSDYSFDEITGEVGKSDKLLILKKPFEPEEVAQLASALTEKWLLARKVSIKFDEIQNMVLHRTRELEVANTFLRNEIDARKVLEKALKESEQKYKLLFDKASDGIFIVQNERIRFSNKSIHRTTLYSERELLKLPLVKLIYHEDVKETLKWYTQRPAEENQQDYHNFRAVNKKGDILYVQATALKVTWDGEPGILTIVRDHSKVRRLEEQLIQSQKMDAIGVLAGGIAHDFNNILSVIIGYTELLMLGTETDSGEYKKSEKILTASYRARELVSQILTFSKQKEQKKEVVQIKIIVKEAVKFLRATIPVSIEFKLEIDDDTCMIIADPTQMHQVVMNLCVNAAHAMDEKGGILGIVLKNIEIDSDATIRHSDLKPGTYIHLSISDTGHGIDEDHLDKIFNPYFTTKKQGEGTGLGLSVVHGIITGIGGVIEVESKKGEGTVFHLYIPCSNREGIEEVEQIADIPTGSESILLVDDEAALTDMLRELLTELGYSVMTKTDSRDALVLFKQDPDAFDLIITDQTMPGMTGVELFEAIMEERPGMPIILCTGFSSVINEEKAKNMGIKAFVKKPFYRREIAEIIRTVLDSNSH